MPCLLQVSLCVCLGLTQLIQCREYRFAVKVSTCNNLPSIMKLCSMPVPILQNRLHPSTFQATSGKVPLAEYNQAVQHACPQFADCLHPRPLVNGDNVCITYFFRIMIKSSTAGCCHKNTLHHNNTNLEDVVHDDVRRLCARLLSLPQPTAL